MLCCKFCNFSNKYRVQKEDVMTKMTVNRIICSVDVVTNLMFEAALVVDLLLYFMLTVST